MATVIERITSYPISDNVFEIQRNEELLFHTLEKVGPVPLRKHEPIKSAHYAATFTPIKFAKPYGVYESDYIRVEWQTMDRFRQPFYHRNADVDELSYQVCGERTLMTERGTVDLEPGDFSRIPVGVAHDNWGIDDIHLLFYIPAPVTECHEITRRADARDELFSGWAPKQVPEVMTLCLGGPECDIATCLIDEKLVVQQAKKASDDDLIKVLRPEIKPGQTTWLYRSKFVWIGTNDRDSTSNSVPVYHRNRCAEEIQCQLDGRRTLVTQRGVIDIEPGDFVCVPTGVAFTDVSHERNRYISILSHHEAPLVAPIKQKARILNGKEIVALRHEKAANGH